MSSITLPATSASVPKLLDIILQAAGEAGLEQNAQFEIMLAAEEMIVNIVNYGYPESSGNISLEINAPEDQPGLRLRISDQGQAFNPLSLTEPDINAPLAERKIGGLGIFIARSKTDRFTYERKDGTNILVLEKHLPHSDGCRETK